MHTTSLHKICQVFTHASNTSRKMTDRNSLGRVACRHWIMEQVREFQDVYKCWHQTTPLKSFRKMPDRIWPRRMVAPVKTISNFARPCKTHASYASWVETKRPQISQIPRRSLASSSLGQATHSNPSNHRMFRKKATGLTLAPMETTWFNRRPTGSPSVSISPDASWDGSKEMPCRMSPGRGGPVFPFTSTFSRFKKNRRSTQRLQHLQHSSICTCQLRKKISFVISCLV